MSDNPTAEKNANSLANTLADRIHRDTIEKNLHEGDFFMTVDQIGDHYAVSRTIAREAVSQLRALGILHSRQRKGLLVGRPDPVALMARSVPFYARGIQGDELLRLAQLRYVLEMGAIELAVSIATQEQLLQLTKTAQEFEVIASDHGHSKEADIVDLSFHRQILEMTDNPLIAGMHRVLSGYFHASTQLEQPPDASRAIHEHQMIVDAIRRQDRELARTVLRCHLEESLRVVQQLLTSHQKKV